MALNFSPGLILMLVLLPPVEMYIYMPLLNVTFLVQKHLLSFLYGNGLSVVIIKIIIPLMTMMMLVIRWNCENQLSCPKPSPSVHGLGSVSLSLSKTQC